MNIFPFVFFSFFVNIIFTPIILRMSKRRGWLDQPNHRTVHKDPVPRLGGVGIFASFFIAVLLALLLDTFKLAKWPESTWNWQFFLLIVGAGSTHVLGVLDDFVEFRAVYKFLLQLFGAVLAIGAGLVVPGISLPFKGWTLDFGPLAPLITLVWIVGVTNAVNLIDGMDGLAGGFSVIALSSLGVYGLLVGLPMVSLLAFAVVAAVLAFLVFNFPPAKIFMGDSGSLFLGYMLATLPLIGGSKSLFSVLWILPIVIVLFPLSDTLAAIIRRLRDGRAIWSPDRFHTHHKLLDLGLSPKQILPWIYGTTLLTAVPVVLAGFPLGHSQVISLWIASLSLGLIVLVLFSTLHFVYYAKHKKG